MAYVIAIVNQKGGVAKTTTAVSIGGALAQMGYDILMIDLDAQADLTLAMGITPSQVRGSVADVLLNSNNLASIRRETAIPGLDLVPSNQEMNLAERFLPIRHNYEQILHKVVQTQLPEASYQYVLLDCPPALGAVTYNALHAANLVIVPTQPEYFSAHALRNVIGAIHQTRVKGNPGLIYRILITLHDKRNRTHRTIAEQLRTTFGNGVLQTVIDVDTKLRESPIVGLPITHFFAKTRGAIQYQALAQELIEHAQETVSPSQASAD